MKTLKFYRSTLAVLLAACCLTACTPKNTGTDTTTSSANTTTSVTETSVVTDQNGNEVSEGAELDENGFIKDSLPDTLDYGGKKVTVLAWDGQSYEEFDTEALTGETINDALYNRNGTVKERIGVNLEFIKTKGGASDTDSYVTQVRGNVMAGGSGSYDLLAAYSRSIAMCAYSGLTQDLMKTSYMDLDKPWWPESLKAQSIINDKLYYCAGDLTISLFHNLPVIYFNKTLAGKYDLTDEMLYKLVLDGKWTIDKMMELSQGTYVDLNGDGVHDDGDQYGYMGQTTQVQPLFWGCGMSAIDVEDGQMKVSESFTGEKMHVLLGKILDWLYNSGNARYSSKGNASFSEGRLLFFQNVASYTMTKFNQVQGLEFGILPCPKANEEQENYASIMGNTITLYAMPINVKDNEMCSAVLECMGSEGYRTLSPAIYESSMKTKYAPDATTAKMYDLIRASAFFDNGRIFSSVLGDLFTGTINNQLKANSADWMSAIAAIDAQLNAKVAEINDVFAKMD